MGRLDVLGEDEHADLRVLGLDPARGPGALVGEARRHPNVDHHEVGPVAGDGGEQPVGVAERGDDLVTSVLE